MAKKWHDKTVIPFKTKGIVGKQLDMIPDHWFHKYWKHNVYWYELTKEKFECKLFVNLDKNDQNRYACMDYIENYINDL